MADCVCLMSLDKHEAVPVDTHLWQITTKHYMPNLVKTKSLTAKAYKQIGEQLMVNGLECTREQVIMAYRPNFTFKMVGHSSFFACVQTKKRSRSINMHGSYSLENVLNFRSCLEKSLNLVKVLEKYLISLSGLKSMSLFREIKLFC